MGETAHVSTSQGPAVTHRCWESYACVISIWGFLLWTGHSPCPLGPPVRVVGGPGWRTSASHRLWEHLSTCHCSLKASCRGNPFSSSDSCCWLISACFGPGHLQATWVPASPRACWPSRGAGEWRRLGSSWWDLGPCPLPHTLRGSATSLGPIRAAP